jgi:alkylated DNA repair dioxygenase AlkB
VSSIEHVFELELQPSLFGLADPAIDAGFSNLRRHQLDPESWLDFAPGWLSGDSTLFDALAASVEWSQPEVKMYDKIVLTPRLTGRVPLDATPVLESMVRALSERYDLILDRLSAGWYRHGQDSVAWHGDRVARELPHSLVATVSLGGPRRFSIRPKAGGTSMSFDLGGGDLVVMGGACQRLWEHTVPKVAWAPPRIALMFRHSYIGMVSEA